MVNKSFGPEYVKAFFGKHLCLAKATVMDLPGDLTTTIAKFPGPMCIRALNTLVPGIHHSPCKSSGAMMDGFLHNRVKDKF